MARSRTMSFVLLSCAVAAGCATKDYGRMEPLAADAVPRDCVSLEAQLFETARFREQVERTSAFGGADVLAFLIDFGIGNAMAKSSALKSAEERETRLKDGQRKLGCHEPGILSADAAR